LEKSSIIKTKTLEAGIKAKVDKKKPIRTVRWLDYAVRKDNLKFNGNKLFDKD